MTVKGEQGKENLAPTFSKQKADQHYSGTYSTKKTTDFNQTNWFLMSKPVLKIRTSFLLTWALSNQEMSLMSLKGLNS